MKIHPEVIGIDANDLDNYGHSHHEDEDFSNPDLDEVPNDIDNKGTNKSENVHALLVRNLSCCIVINNDLGAHILSVNPDAANAPKFSEYPI
ncbi:hypothetical protein PVK06_018705 [Gossypium arboreum]|uniref:Uncharacterized protein n=1 Tax=Gossypium arboreum TaxID=29729 RepID=A0ABR0PHN1_GOSAR|nr:hypothetical protein PVK06_018705 [Gossypium arboreum]